MEPTMGRIVYYTPSDPTDTSAVEAPAIVSRVNTDGTVDLTVFPPDAASYTVGDVSESESGGSENGKWCWPTAAPSGSAPESADKPTPAEPVGGGNEGSTEAGGTDQAPGNGEGQAGSTTDPESPGPDDAGSGDTPTTSAASEKPLYAIVGPEVPADFEPSGLETPEGGTLYHYAPDTAGQAHTFDLTGVEGISLYAEADDNEQPVKPAETAATS